MSYSVVPSIAQHFSQLQMKYKCTQFLLISERVPKQKLSRRHIWKATASNQAPLLLVFIHLSRISAKSHYGQHFASLRLLSTWKTRIRRVVVVNIGSNNVHRTKPLGPVYSSEGWPMLAYPYHFPWKIACGFSAPGSSLRSSRIWYTESHRGRLARAFHNNWRADASTDASGQFCSSSDDVYWNITNMKTTTKLTGSCWIE